MMPDLFDLQIGQRVVAFTFIHRQIVGEIINCDFRRANGLVYLVRSDANRLAYWVYPGNIFPIE